MKILNIIFLFLILQTIQSFSLNKLQKVEKSVDDILFEKINNYRKENHLKPFVWNDSVYEMAKHHSEYLQKYDDEFGSQKKETKNENIIFLSHYEDSSLIGFNSLKEVIDRALFFLNNLKHKNVKVEENVLSFCNNYYVGNNEKIAEKIFKLWKNSPKHNENMLTKTEKFKNFYAACSSISKTTYLNYNIKGKEIHPKLELLFSTLDIVFY